MGYIVILRTDKSNICKAFCLMTYTKVGFVYCMFNTKEEKGMYCTYKQRVVER